MLKKLTNPWFLGAIAIFLFVVAMLGSSIFQECASNSAYTAQNQQNSSPSFFSVVNIILDWSYLDCVGSFIHHSHEEILAAFTVLLALFTLALWASTSQIAKDAKLASDKTIGIMENTAEMQLRAYVNVKGSQAYWVDHETLEAIVTIQNFGQTPAYDVVQWIGIGAVNEGGITPIANPGDDLKKSRGIIAPTNHVEFSIELHDKITQEKLSMLKAGKAVIYVLGEITYKDVFNQPRFTKYKLFLTGKETEKGRFSECEDGNEAS